MRLLLSFRRGLVFVNLAAVLLTGLFAGGVSCAAVQGGLLTRLITRQRGRAPSPALARSCQSCSSHAGLTTSDTAAAGVVSSAQPSSWRGQLGEDLAPVGGFLVGKLLSHTVLGALLGTVGGAVQLSIGARTGLQIGAGLLIVILGLAQLGVPGFRGIVIEPLLSWMRVVRNQARSQVALAPALLGVATVLIPCG